MFLSSLLWDPLQYPLLRPLLSINKLESCSAPKDQLNDLTYLLNERELQELQNYTAEYIRRYGSSPDDDPDAVFFLGDNTRFSYTWSCHSNSLPTFRRNSGMFWSPFRKRWMVSADKLAFLSFPVSSGVARILGVPSPLPVTDVRRGHSVCGNAMNMANCMVVFLLAITCFGPNMDPTPSIDWTQLP